MITALTETLFCLPIAMALAIIWDHYFGWTGHWCQMQGCHRFGRYNFSCCECSRKRLYFCNPCSIKLVHVIQRTGVAWVRCPGCAKKQRSRELGTP